MQTLIKNIRQLLQVREGVTPILKGEQMAELPVLENAWILVQGNLIQDYGTMATCPEEAALVVDATGCVVLPTWVDSHTHIVFAAPREGEFVMRLKGKSYEDIAAAGGGILNSANKLRLMSEDDLFEQAATRLERLILNGTGAIEIKSGYGLTLEAEIKMLRVASRLKEKYDIPIKTTLLAAHAIPTEFKENREGYIQLIINDIIPKVSEEKLANYIDVFCEKGFFTPEETDRILKAGIAHGLLPKIHANQLAVSGGVQVGVANNAISVDHLEQIGDAEIQALQNSTTVPVGLPGCSFFLGIPFTPVRKLLSAGLPVALASDYNPGSAPSGNMNTIVSLACVKMKLTPEEAINACTINAAHALELGDSIGSITKGKKANLILTKPISSYNYLPYSFGENCIDRVMINGSFV